MRRMRRTAKERKRGKTILGVDETGPDWTRLDKSGRVWTRLNETERDQTRLDESGPDCAGLHEPRPGWAPLMLLHHFEFTEREPTIMLTLINFSFG